MRRHILISSLAIATLVAPVAAKDAVVAKTSKVKPPLRGLVSMGSYKFVNDVGEPDNEESLQTVRKKPGLLRGVVIVATWRDLEKSATSGLTANNQIDRGLAAVRKYNTEHPQAPLAVKLRVWGGYFAPEWVMNLTGGKIDVVHTNVNAVEKKRTLGHAWTPAYRKHWAHLQELLAAKYDGEPLVHEVAVTSCMLFTAEPFSIDTSDGALKPLRKAGLTDKAYKDCLDGIVDDYQPWKTTRFETPLNPFRLTDATPPKHDLQFTKDWITSCHKREPERCALDNHDLDKKDTSAELDQLYAAMKTSGAEVEFQTFREMPEDVLGTIQLAVQKGATSVELWQDYKGFPEIPNALLEKLAKELEKNAGNIKD